MKTLFFTIIFSLFALNVFAWSLSLSFDGVGGATGYNAYYKTQDMAGYQKVDIGNNTTYEFYDKETNVNPFNLTEDKTVSFYVTAYNDAGESAGSNIVEWIVPTEQTTITVPGQPKLLRIIQTQTTEIITE